MRSKILMTVGVAALMAAGPATAAGAGASKEETVGVGSGLIIGALAGGPAGAIIGAAIGAKLGDSMHDRNERIATLDANLTEERQSVAELNRSLVSLDRRNKALDRDIQRLRDMERPELEALLQAGIEMDLLFRTDEHVLTQQTGERFSDLAASVAAMPDLNIRVDGYSDERGDEEYNRELSAKRAEHVRDLLQTAGVPANRIVVEAHGESPVTDQNPDSYALERRVSVTLFVDSQRVAANGSD